VKIIQVVTLIVAIVVTEPVLLFKERIVLVAQVIAVLVPAIMIIIVMIVRLERFVVAVAIVIAGAHIIALMSRLIIINVKMFVMVIGINQAQGFVVQMALVMTLDMGQNVITIREKIKKGGFAPPFLLSIDKNK
jgi:hypothetical protein